MTGALRHWFDVRPGEGTRVVRAGSAMFMLLAGFTLGETARDSLFLGAGGRTQLAIAYLALAGIAVGAVAVNARLVRRVGRRRALIATLLVAAVGTTSFGALPYDLGTSFALYLWTGLVGTLVVVQFWLLAATRFTSAQAKRLFGPIAACGAVGTLAGSVLATGLLELLPVRALLPAAGVCYVVAALLLAKDRDGVELRLGGPEAKRLVSRHRTLAGRPSDKRYVARLVLFTVCATAAAMFADYLFKTQAAARFETAELASFIARFTMGVALCSIVFQLFGASWLVRRAGVLGMIPLLPALLLCGSIATVLFGSFVAVISTKAADGALRYSVNRVALELLWLPVPEPDRGRIREPLESVVMRSIQAVCAVALLILGALELADERVIGGVLIGLTGLWFATALTLRGGYLAQLRSTIGTSALRGGAELELKNADLVVEVLASDDERRVLTALEILRDRGRGKAVPALILHHPSYDVLALALEIIAVPTRNDWQPLTRRLLEAREARIRMLAIRALAEVGDEAAIMVGLCDDNPSVVAHAMFWQLQSKPRDQQGVDSATTQLLSHTGPGGDVAREHLLSAIREHGDQRWLPTLLAIAAEPAGPWIAQLALAIARIPDPAFTPLLLARLDKHLGRTEVLAALAAIGAPALDALSTLLADPSIHRRVRLHVPSAIAGFASERAAGVLVARLADEPSGTIRYRILKALALLATRDEIIVDATTLRAELVRCLTEHEQLVEVAGPVFAAGDPSESARLLEKILRDKLAKALDRVFLALQAMHPRENMRSVQRALGATDPHERAHGSELLDTLTRSALYDDGAGTTVRSHLARIVDGAAPAEATSLERVMIQLIDDRDELVAAFAAYRALELDRPELRAALRRAQQRRDVFAPLGIVHVGLHAAG